MCHQQEETFVASHGQCLTTFSCSGDFVKAGGFGFFCVKKSAEADAALQVAIKSRAFKCPAGKVMCYSGHCRDAINDCPQETTCSSNNPYKCQDGQCVSSPSKCDFVDRTVLANLNHCIEQGLLLCESDL